MGEIKFNRMRLLDCKASIDYLTRELQKNADDAMVLINGFDQERQYRLWRTMADVNEAIIGLGIMSDKLAKLSDLYSECERSVEDLVNRLIPPATAVQPLAALASTPFITEYSASCTIPRDLHVESWIMELIYSEGI